MPFVNFLEGTAATATEAITAITSVFTNVTGAINIQSVLSVLGIVVAAAIGLVLMWWGIRKVIRVIMSAFKKGKIAV